MIRLPNVNEDFLGVDQVINGHGIESGFEFLEKEKLNEEQKDLDVTGDKDGAEHRYPMPAGGKLALGNDHEPEQQRNREDEAHEHVAMKAVQKGAGYLGWRQAGRREREEE